MRWYSSSSFTLAGTSEKLKDINSVHALLLFRSHSVFVENVLGFVDQVCNQRLIRTDGAEVQVLDIRKEVTFHLATAYQSQVINTEPTLCIVSYTIDGNKISKACGAKGILYPWELLSTADDFHESSVDELPTFLKAWTEVNVRLIHV